VIGLLIEKQVTYSDVEADALIARAKKLAEESGRTVRAEAELLLSRTNETRLRDLRDRVTEADGLLAAIAVEVDDLRAELGDGDGELVVIMATMSASCEPFASVPPGGSTSTSKRGELRASSAAIVVPGPIEDIEDTRS
jgi:hypothetical protein